jgi:hypothetical protein
MKINKLMFLLWILLISGWPSAGFAVDTAGLGPCDRWFPAEISPPKGVVLLTHGMNLRPERMDEWARELARDGYEVLRPAFTGHCGDEAAYLEIFAAQWERDARSFYALAADRARERKVPLLLAAYSFTALIYQTLSAELPFARKIYFAPALATHFWYRALIGVASWVPGFTFASRNLTDYRANARSGMKSLMALHDFVLRWQGGAGRRDEGPVLAWLEPEDELVSYSRLQDFASNKANWRLERVTNVNSTLPRTYHHLIISEESLGQAEWGRMVRETLAFLREGEAPHSSSR